MAVALNRAAQAVLYPDAVIVACLSEDKGANLAVLTSDRVQQSIARFAGKASVHLAVFGVTGDLVEIAPIQTHSATDALVTLAALQAQCKGMLDAGVHAVFSQKGVVVPAPPGFEFIKPSGERSSHFLRAEEALSNSAAVDFIAFALLRRIQIQDLKVIFVDSMAIASIAYAIREIRSRAGLPMPQIVSFHSHEGLAATTVPPSGTFFCIISASSSLSLEKKWLEYTGCAEGEVVTLLTFRDAITSQQPMCAVDRPQNWRDAQLPVAGIRGLRIFGERFQPEQMPAKKVLLGLKKHRCENATLLAERFHNARLFSVDGLDDLGKRRALYADGATVLANGNFDDWLKKQLRSRVPASIQGIIYQDDPASLAMANTCRRILAAMQVSWGLHSSSTFEGKLDEVDRHRAILVVAAVIGKGSTLLGISRDLRASHFGARTYLCGLQVCATDASATSLRSNLAQTKDGTAYFGAFHVAAVGSALEQSLRQEADILRLKDSRLDVLEYRWAPSRNAGLVTDAFLPSLVSGKHRLVLRPDFAFWKPGYVEGASHAPMVLATIGAILERARTPTIEEDDHRLSSAAFQQVVLDPQNFTRYNDGLIQSALLRQAYPSELDSSSLPENSSFMLLFLKKLFAARHSQQGEAAPEFAYALGVGRLKLQPRDLQELVTHVRGMVGQTPGDAELMALLSPEPANADGANAAVI
ncbi:hypothetical protein CTP10_R47170 [Cupriavidus sp. P-10]|uniref:hypothetical protein n=1 Tax=Cupriavidus sp. P-10 TaxID=2027911 RepID=UPI000E2FC1FF|nr:hypothetical protein [Cupriavidus sp. P-10]BDB27312.1 hypothetical protein CTP10_R47170 [Cupriavidus sp. P-10]